MLMKIRKQLIRWLAGDMGVALNVQPIMDDDGPAIAYAQSKGGMCERTGVK